MIKVKYIVVIFCSVISLCVSAQGKPEKFSSDFLNALINYDEVKLKGFINPDPKIQAVMLVKLKDVYENKIKPIKTPALTTSVRAVLKEGNEEFKKMSDIRITISPDQKTKYELVLWGCYVKDEKWWLGEKMEFNKLVSF